QLAGRGDIKRFFDRYEQVKQKFQGVKQDDDKFNDLWQEISPLQTSIQSGLFHQDSILYRSVKHTLTPEQAPRYEAAAAERRAFRHRANIEVGVALLEQAMPLREGQRRELIDLLKRETKPPRRSGQYEYYFMM